MRSALSLSLGSLSGFGASRRNANLYIEDIVTEMSGMVSCGIIICGRYAVIVEQMTDIINYHGRTGSGKSTRMKQNVLDVVGRHLFVVPRKQSIEECHADLVKLRSDTMVPVTIIAFLRDDEQYYRTKIATEIADRATQFDEDAHCCLIVTQAACQKLDLVNFAGWHLKLDKLLANGNLSGSLHGPIMWPGLANLFDLQPLSDTDLQRGIATDFLRLTVREGVEAKDVFADTRLGQDDENLYQRVASPIPVYTDAQGWHDVRDRRCSWCSPWTLDFVDAFANIEIAACDIEESLMHLISPRSYIKVLCPTPASAAKIKVYYFDAGPATCSATFWEEPKGHQNLTLIGREIAHRGGVDFWTCNATV